MSKITYRQKLPICVFNIMQRKRVQAKEHRDMLTHDPVSATQHNHTERQHRASRQTTNMWEGAYQQCTNRPAPRSAFPKKYGRPALVTKGTHAKEKISARGLKDTVEI
jgi:hypothetical protein